MMKKYIIAMIASAVLLGGCATNTGLSNKEKDVVYGEYIQEQKLESLKKIHTFRFHGWQSLTNDYLILSTSPKKKYLVEVKGYCPDLSFAQGILINQAMSSTLTTKFDSISVLGSNSVGGYNIKCYIKSIHKVSKEQAKEIAAIGKPVDNQQTEEPVTQDYK